MCISQAREELHYKQLALVPAPLEVGYGNECGVQLRHGIYWGAALPTAPLEQIKDLLCLEHHPCPAAERDRQL